MGLLQVVKEALFSEPTKANVRSSGEYGGGIYIPQSWGNTFIGLDGVGSETALKLAAVYRSIDILSSTIAALPFELKRKKNGVFVVEDSDITNFFLNVRSNERMSAYDTMRNAVIQMVISGNAYLMPEYGLDGEMDRITLLTPNTTTYDSVINRYYVNDLINGFVGTYRSDEIIHIRNMSIDGGYTGVSTLQYASKVLGIASAADSKSLESFQPGSGRMGFISGDSSAGVQGFGEFQDEQLKTVGERVESELRSGKQIFFLPENMKFNSLSLSPNDIQLLESKKLSVLDICRFFGVHPDKVFAGQSQNYKASEMSQVQFYSDTLRPRLRQIEAEFTSKLVHRRVWNKYKIEFDLESLYSTDLATEATYMKETIQNGVITVNEWKRRKGQPRVEGGDETLVSTNTTTLKSLIEGEKREVNASDDVKNIVSKK